MGGQKVAVFTVKAERGEWTFLIAQPKPCLLVCATDKAYLEETLKRVNGQAGKRALPDDLQEWKQVDAEASVWAVRHYCKETAEKDHSSPLKARYLFAFDPDAAGVVLWYNADSDKSVRVRYLTGAKDAVNVMTEGKEPRFEMKKVGPGCVEIVVTKSALELSDKLLWIDLMAYLGHYIYL